jgi:hypothetical protein
MRIVSSHLVFLAVSVLTACSHAPSPPAADEGKGATATACPEAVKQAITKDFPDSSVTGCKAEHEDGHDQFEVKLTKKGGEKVEVDVAPDGAILQTEEGIALDKVPAKVTAGFAAKYPNAKPTTAEKQVRTGKGSFYELAFTADGKTKEATFSEEGSFVEEE